MHVWLNGGLVDTSEAHLPVDDHGLIVGDGAFETLKTSGGEAFAVTRHLKRLAHSLSGLGIAKPDDDILRSAIAETVESAGHTEARVRLTVTAGSGSLGSWMPGGPPSVFVVVTELKAKSAPVAITVPWTRNERGATAGLKTTSYAENVRALRAATDADATESLLANTVGELCEGTGTNVFIVDAGRVLTPPLSSGCLAGITRELVLEVASVTEQALPFEILQTASEVFLTSSTRDVQGLTQIDGRPLEVGSRTTEIAAAFNEILATRIDP